jgi:phosphatidylserine decarboxylase
MIVGYGLKLIMPGVLLTAILCLLAARQDSVWLLVLALIFAVLTVFLTYFYRNPVRNIPNDSRAILAIADGRVLAVEPIEHNYIGGRGNKVSIFLSILDVHINRMPCDGTVEYVKYTPGKFFAAYVDKASDENEHTEIGYVFKAGKMIFKQIAGIMARRIEYDLKNNQQARAGDIFGMIHFGSRAEFFLPESVEVTVRPGHKVKAGETIIGRIKVDE